MLDVLATVLTILALALNGLMAGVFFAFSTAVMPGLDAAGADHAAASMRGINQKILNPRFLSTFTLAPVASLAGGVLMLIAGRTAPAIALLAAALVYFLGSIVVTAVVNVPMNNAIDAGDLEWTAYRPRWTRWNTLRGWASTAALVLIGVGLHLSQ
ncbi:DUF1772 domain-containing protein [Nonomuraea sp. NN258]|uniref:anthrone oxygenase family protein n=1 Tax=Nonomuraea antri TaxID=2730852 RepID=UPI001568F2B7|nr:anthrone oxygenase family protein [Nonomuraea antri]NRQ37128.1 DUF1772 domain-containing protein [Nonomuraea antri]